MNDLMRPILVTGAHRSGTTWAGKILAADAQTSYINEPLNVFHRPGVFRADVQHWYQYICDENEHSFLQPYKETIEFDYHLMSELRSLRSIKDIVRMIRDFTIFYNALMRGHRALLKDPFAVFSIPWFIQRLNCQVVVTVRHPAAFASSLIRLGWDFNFNDLLEQPLLMRDHLEIFRDEMLGIKKGDILGQASVLWKMIYGSVHSIRKANPSIIIVRNEDLSLDPVTGYKNIYSKLGLDFSSRVQKFVRDSSSSDNPKELSRKKTHSVKMDSAAQVKSWKKRLDDKQVERIRSIVGGISSLYYSDEDWR